MPRLTKIRARAAALHAVQSYAKKQGDRTQLVGGDAFPVDLKISGTVGKLKVEESISGNLSIGHDFAKNSNNGIAPTKVIAWLITQTPEPAKCAEQLRAFAKATKEGETLGDNITADQEAQAKQLLSLFNQVETKVSKGSVSFAVAKKAAA